MSVCKGAFSLARRYLLAAMRFSITNLLLPTTARPVAAPSLGVGSSCAISAVPLSIRFQDKAAQCHDEQIFTFVMRTPRRIVNKMPPLTTQILATASTRDCHSLCKYSGLVNGRDARSNTLQVLCIQARHLKHVHACWKISCFPLF